MQTSRKTLAYAVRELQRDIDILEGQQTAEQRAATPKTELGVFVVHNKCVVCASPPCSPACSCALVAGPLPLGPSKSSR